MWQGKDEASTGQLVAVVIISLVEVGAVLVTMHVFVVAERALVLGWKFWTSENSADCTISDCVSWKK